MRGRISLGAVAAVMTTLVIAVPSAAACSCAFIPPKKLLKRADGAFNGRLLSVDLAEGMTEAAFRYRVGVVAKGPFRRGRVVTVWAQNEGSTCGLPRTTGVVYGLFVSQADARWTGGLCGTVSAKTMRSLARNADSASSATAESSTACPV